MIVPVLVINIADKEHILRTNYMVRLELLRLYHEVRETVVVGNVSRRIDVTRPRPRMSGHRMPAAR